MGLRPDQSNASGRVRLRGADSLMEETVGSRDSYLVIGNQCHGMEEPQKRQSPQASHPATTKTPDHSTLEVDEDDR